MTDGTHGATFDDGLIEGVAADRGVDPDALRAAVRDHQRGMDDLPGAENLVYEWRRRFDGALLERTDAAYHLAAPEDVWTEFGDHLSLSVDLLSALRETHRRTVGERIGADDPGDGRAFVVVERP